DPADSKVATTGGRPWVPPQVMMRGTPRRARLCVMTCDGGAYVGCRAPWMLRRHPSGRDDLLTASREREFGNKRQALSSRVCDSICSQSSLIGVPASEPQAKRGGAQLEFPTYFQERQALVGVI